MRRMGQNSADLSQVADAGSLAGFRARPGEAGKQNCRQDHNDGDNHEQLVRRVFPRMARVRTAVQVAVMLAAGDGG